MDIPCLSNSKGKAKQDDIKHDPNWTAEETTHLLNAVSHLQTVRGRVGFSFTLHVRSEIYRLFKVSVPRTTRKKEKIINMLKVLTKMYKVCNELAIRSGGGWDDVNHRPIAPSETEYEEMVRAKGENEKFLLTKNFPWFWQMTKMVGSQTAKGEIKGKTCNKEAPIHCLLDTHMSIVCSEQDSSDSPDDSNRKDRDSDSLRPPGRGSGASFYAGGQSSDASGNQSRNYGSKRKSTDDSNEPSSKGKRFKERVRKKKVEQERLADTALEIARVISEEFKLKLTKSEEEDKCMSLFDAWGIRGRYNDFCSTWMGNNYMRKWFLRNERHVVVEWIERNIAFEVPDPNPPPNNYVPFQSYFQPSPAAFNVPSFNPNP